MPQGERPPLMASEARPRSRTAVASCRAMNSAAARSATGMLSQATHSTGLATRAGVAPAARVGRQRIGLRGSPTALRIGPRRPARARLARDDAVHDTPRRLDRVLPGEEGGVAAQRIADQSFVGARRTRLVVAHQELARSAAHLCAWLLGENTQCNGYPVRAQPE